jgi:hypothetical protein
VEVGVALDEPRRRAGAQAHHVLPNEHLGVAVGAGADADRGDADRLGDLGRNPRRHHLHDDRERAGLLQRERLADEPLGGVAATLHSVAAEVVLGLRRESDVRHHRDAGVGEQLDLGHHRVPTFELDGLGVRLLHEPHRGVERLLRRTLVGAEGQVGDDERAVGRSGDGAHERDQLVDRDRQRRCVAIDVVGRRVADQQHRNAGLVEDLCRVLVVGGEHGPLLTVALPLLQVMRTHLANVGRGGGT